MEQNRVEILNMFKEGTLTLEEAAELLGALSQPETEIALKDTRGRKRKKLRIQVDAAENGSSGKTKVNVALPISLVKSLSPLIAKSLPAEAKDEMSKAGVDLEAIIGSLDTLIESAEEEDIVNIDTGGSEDMAKVRVFVD
ncbi:MAG: hypothetical protein BWY62_01131 [Firmicutes bacterium ADurb.Bin356]|nr:MAG: hypothetical protein BWY62_01131 [Firmicutes bacterium ADurb.Bin356]